MVSGDEEECEPPFLSDGCAPISIEDTPGPIISVNERTSKRMLGMLLRALREDLR